MAVGWGRNERSVRHSCKKGREFEIFSDNWEREGRLVWEESQLRRWSVGFDPKGHRYIIILF